MKRFTHQSSNPKRNAQKSLEGITHYVDDGTLKFHKSRILSTHILDEGLLFALVESCALDMHNTSRGFRYVIFDVMGTVIGRVTLEEAFKTRRQAEKAMWAYVDTLDAKALTKEAIERFERQAMDEVAQAKKDLLT